MPEKYKFEIIESPEDILTYIGIGVKNIFPNLHTYCSDEEWGIFERFLIREIECFGAELLILKEEGVITGCVLIYSDNESDTLFFGFFGVLDHQLTRIEVLIEKLIETARHTGKYRFLRGPINVPTVIFGWGFSALGFDEVPFIGCPINPQVYQEGFMAQGFYIKLQEDRYNMSVLKYNPYLDPNFLGFTDYIYVNPGKTGMEKIKNEFIDLHVKELGGEIITHGSERNFDNIVDFVFEFGSYWMMFIVYHINTSSERIKDEIVRIVKEIRESKESSLFEYCQKQKEFGYLDIVSCGYVIPNPFSKTGRGKLDSVSFHSWVVKTGFQGKGLSRLMFGASALHAYKDDKINKIRWGSAPINKKNEKSTSQSIAMGGRKNRSHLVLEYDLSNS